MTFDFERDCHPYTAEELIESYRALEVLRDAGWELRWSARRYAGYVLNHLMGHHCRPARPRGVSERMVLKADRYLQIAEELEKERKAKP